MSYLPSLLSPAEHSRATSIYWQRITCPHGKSRGRPLELSGAHLKLGDVALAQRRGRIRVGSLAGANADHFTLFGGTFGVAAELNVSQSWALFAKARYSNLG